MNIYKTMQTNRLTIRIARPIHEVFAFCITPPNTTRWIEGVVNEKTNEWPARVGTVYKLYESSGRCLEVAISDLVENKTVEWISKDGNYHCHYTFRTIDASSTELEYLEWVDCGELDAPFTQSTLEKLKKILEA